MRTRQFVLPLMLLLAACRQEQQPVQEAAETYPAVWEITDEAGALEGWLFGTVHALPEDLDWKSDLFDGIEERGRSVSTRNQRLAALRSFLAFAAQEDVACMAVLARSHRVPKKKTVNKPVGYLTEGQLAALLEQPDPDGEQGTEVCSCLRDHSERNAG